MHSTIPPGGAPVKAGEPWIGYDATCRACGGAGCEGCSGRGHVRRYDAAGALYARLRRAGSPLLLAGLLVRAAEEAERPGPLLRRNGLLEQADQLSREAALLRAVAKALAEACDRDPPPPPAAAAGWLRPWAWRRGARRA